MAGWLTDHPVSLCVCGVCVLAVGKSSIMLQLLEQEFDPLIR